jgi:hypothetical protein
VLWCPNVGPQTAFLASDAREVLYGGAVGGGKTDALIMAQLRYCDNPKHTGIILRRTRKRLQEVVDRTRQLIPELYPTAQWHETEGRWKMPSGASVFIGYAEHEPDIEAWKSFELNLICFDELTEFTKYQYTFMLSRNRTKDKALPSQLRNATNPGGEGMEFVLDRFIREKTPFRVYEYDVYVRGMGKLLISRQFVPSTVFDNPKLPNKEAYVAGLASMGEEMADAMLYGLWDRFRGQYFRKLPKITQAQFKDHDWYVIRSMDYGWTDQTCILWLVAYVALRRIEVAAEVYANRLTTDSIAHLVKEIEKRNGFQGRVLRSVLSPDRFRTGTDGGLNIPTLLAQKGVWFEKANNDRIAGWANIQRLIQNDTLFLWEGRAPNLQRTLPTLPRNPTKPDDVLDKGVEDHAAEALRYGCMVYYEAPPSPEMLEQLAENTQPGADHRDTEYDKIIDKLERAQGGKDQWLEGLGSWS